MAGKVADLIATERTGTGKGAARQARRNGDVPGIVYGGGVTPLPVNIDFNKLLTRLRQGRFLSTLFNLKVEGHDDTRVICRAVQRDVVKDLPTHVDFMRLKSTSQVDLFIGIDFINESEAPGIKQGGVLTVVRPEIELRVTANDIPESIVIDLTGREIGDVIHIGDITLPAGAKPTIERNYVIANVSAPTVLLASDEEEAAEAAAADEVEVVGEEGKDDDKD